MVRTKESMEKEQQMMEKELLMKNHLKEAQLKYLQSQINPHFLFNSLNAGVQLAMMEDAEKTCIFVEKMADFFRYNVKKGLEDASLGEELTAVENYIYILNVRFAGDIHFTKKVDESIMECRVPRKGLEDASLGEELTAVENYIYILNVRFAGDIHFTKKVDESIMECRVPSMILQPLVENAVNHGIRNIDWEGKILLEITGLEDNILIRVKDNGKGMSEERIREVLDGCMEDTGEQSDSTGVGMNNVISRLELYYDKKNLVEINSPGENMGTEIILTLPRTGGEK